MTIVEQSFLVFPDKKEAEINFKHLPQINQVIDYNLLGKFQVVNIVTYISDKTIAAIPASYPIDLMITHKIILNKL